MSTVRGSDPPSTVHPMTTRFADTPVPLTHVTSAELHALWGMVEAEANFSPNMQALLERWQQYVRAQRERYGR